MTFFLGGLMGSLTHCLAMCGPAVACQAACGNACGKRLSAASQWQYHAGRFLTYGAFGFAAGLLAKQIAAFTFWPTLSSAMLLVAGGLFLMSALFPQHHLLLRRVPQSNFLRGVLMSFMPCGLLYAALMMAATLANPWISMGAMWLFVLGTLPALLLASGGALLLAQRWHDVMGRVGRLGMACNGLALLALAVKTVR